MRNTYRNYSQAFACGFYEDELYSQSEYSDDVERLEYSESWEGQWGLPTEDPWEAVDASLDKKKRRGEW